MSIIEEILDKLKQEREEGKTYKEISEGTGVTPSYICRLLNPKTGKEKIQKMELDTLMKLFPNARIVFDDRRMMGDVTNNSGQVVNGDVTAPLPPLPQQQGARDADEFLARIMASDEIDAETKVKIFNLHTTRGPKA